MRRRVRRLCAAALSREPNVHLGPSRHREGRGAAVIVKGDPLLVEEPIDLFEGLEAFEAQLLRQLALPGPKQPFAASPSLG